MRVVIAVVSFMALILAGLFSAMPYAKAAIGNGGAGGGSGGSGTNNILLYLKDDINDDPIDPPQGWGTASAGYAIQEVYDWMHDHGYDAPSNEWLESGGLSYDAIMPACETALKNASQRGGFGTNMEKSRVVGLAIGWGVADGEWASVWGATAEVMWDGIQAQWPTAEEGLLGYDAAHIAAVKTGVGGFYDWIYDVNQGDSVSVVCVALNEDQWTQGYELTIETSAKNTFSLAGGTEAVYDEIIPHTTGPAIEETLNATITMGYDAPGHTEGDPTKSVTHDFTMSNRSTTNSPEFTPEQFGFQTWPKGDFWYEVNVPGGQGKLKEGVTHGGRGVAGESWTAKGYNLEVRTEAQVNPDEFMGTATPVHDLIIASNDADVTEELVGVSTMYWDGYPATDGTPIKSASKDVKFTSNGNTEGEDFTPADFGWDVWPGGRWWFGFAADQQGAMDAPFVEPDRAEGEVWDVPPTISKTLYAADGTELTPEQAEAAGMPFDAKITATAVGATKMVITDRIETTDVWVGGDDSNDPAGIYVLGPNGKKVDADVTVTVEGGATLVEATLGSADKGAPILPVGDYTMVVKTTPKATGADFTIQDTPSACYQTEGVNEECITGPPVTTEKVTPKPNKVWSKDAAATLEDNDPEWTNEKGVDTFTFLPGDEISAVLNGSVHADLSDALYAYEIGDDWSEASKYVDFTKPGNAEVFVQWPGEEFKNVSADFNFQTTYNKGGQSTTVATAKAGSQFLADTKGLSEEAVVKLVMDGTFYEDIDTDGALAELHNTGWEVWNNEKAPANKPPVYVWTPKPVKEDLRCDLDSKGQGLDTSSCVDIDKDTVIKGDRIDYRLTLDAGVAGMKPDTVVHKLGMVDTFDREYLSIPAKDVIVEVATAAEGSDFKVGQNVTDLFNVQVDARTGVAYIFAKTVDTTVEVDGKEVTIKGDPQPADLAAYNAAAIDPATQAAIDQALVGNTFHIYLQAEVIKSSNDHTIVNKAVENFNNLNKPTLEVSNPLKEIKPSKDVAMTAGGKSVDKGTIPLYTGDKWEHTKFYYELESSTIPAKRAYPTSEWTITDAYNAKYDKYEDSWQIRANTDIYNGKTLVAKKGAVIASSDFVTAKDAKPSGKAPVFQDSFRVFDTKNVLTVEVLDGSYLKAINSRLDLPQSWTADVKFERIRPGTVDNMFTEEYNKVKRPSNKVVTETPEHPAISLVKWDKNSGIKTGARDTAAKALTVKAGSSTQIMFTITNTGDVPLTNLHLTDATVEGSGTVENIKCPAGFDKKVLQMGESIICEGTLTGVKPATTHKDEAKVTGESIFTGKKVTDNSVWYAKEASLEHAGGGLAVTGATAITAGLIGAALLGAGVVMRRRLATK